jgi:hypothetical protein
MTIALSTADLPAHLNHTYSDFRRMGYVVVRASDLLALEAAKHQYEQFYLDSNKDHLTLHPRSQRDPAPVEQSDLPAPQHTEPGLEQKIRFLNKENAALLQSYLTLLHLYQLIKQGDPL